MKVLFMGTGAADWIISERREHEFFRRLTSAKVNEDLMIDCSADTEDYINQNDISLIGIKDLLITHTHSDHYSPDTIKNYLSKNIKIWAEEKAQAQIVGDLPEYNLCKVSLFKPIQVGDYEIIAVPANHSVSDIEQIPLHYIIKHGGKTVFWGCDGAWFTNQSWNEIRKHTYDLFVLDGTLGDAVGDYRVFEHNNLNMICEMAATIRSQNLLKENGRIIISHMSRYAHKPHEVLTKDMKNYEIEVAYDGLELEI